MQQSFTFCHFLVPGLKLVRQQTDPLQEEHRQGAGRGQRLRHQARHRGQRRRGRPRGDSRVTLPFTYASRSPRPHDAAPWRLGRRLRGWRLASRRVLTDVIASPVTRSSLGRAVVDPFSRRRSSRRLPWRPREFPRRRPRRTSRKEASSESLTLMQRPRMMKEAIITFLPFMLAIKSQRGSC